MPELTDLEWELVCLVLWLLASGVAAVAVALFWRWLLTPLAAKRADRLSSTLVEVTDGAVPWVAFSAVLYTGSQAAFQGFAQSEMGQTRTGSCWTGCCGAIYVNLVLALTYLTYCFCKGLVDSHAERFRDRTHAELDSQAVLLFQRFAKLLFLTIAVTIIFEHFDVSIAGILAAGSIGAFAIAFAARDTLANMISGIILMIDRPFKRGDRITLPSGEWGDVVEIGLRTTKVLSFTQKVIVIPNAEIAKSQVVNHSAPDQQLKIEHHLGVAYSSDMKKVKRILFGILRQHPDILNYPPYQVYFVEFGDSALNLTLFFWIGDYRERYRVTDEVNMAIKDRFEAEGVEIPFPQHDLHLRSLPPGGLTPGPAG